MNAFNNRGGRAHPVLNVNGTPNLTEPATQMLRERFGDNAPGNLVYYLAALTGHPGYVRTFDEPLQHADTLHSGNALFSLVSRSCGCTPTVSVVSRYRV